MRMRSSLSGRTQPVSEIPWYFNTTPPQCRLPFQPVLLYHAPSQYPEIQRRLNCSVARLPHQIAWCMTATPVISYASLFMEIAGGNHHRQHSLQSSAMVKSRGMAGKVELRGTMPPLYGLRPGCQWILERRGRSAARHIMAELTSRQIGKYQIQAELGRGGFGSVYRAYDPTVGRLVAIKVLTASGDQQLLTRFKNEAGAAGNLRHKNIVTIYDFGEHEGLPYIVMEFLEGEDLQQVISSKESR